MAFRVKVYHTCAQRRENTGHQTALELEWTLGLLPGRKHVAQDSSRKDTVTQGTHRKDLDPSRLTPQQVHTPQSKRNGGNLGTKMLMFSFVFQENHSDNDYCLRIIILEALYRNIRNVTLELTNEPYYSSDSGTKGCLAAEHECYSSNPENSISFQLKVFPRFLWHFNKGTGEEDLGSQPDSTRHHTVPSVAQKLGWQQLHFSAWGRRLRCEDRDTLPGEPAYQSPSSHTDPAFCNITI